MSDEPSTRKKQEGDILKEEIAEGLAGLRRNAIGLFISAISGGLDLGFSILLAATVVTVLGGEPADLLRRFAVANAYAFGFLLVILGRSELFTEQTTLAILPVLHRRASVRMLLRLWGLIYVGNLIGAGAFALIAAIVGPSLGIAQRDAYVQIGQGVLDHPWWVIILSGSLAGWLMGLLSWLVTASKETISQIVVVWLITGTIGFLLLHHSILGFTEVVAALVAGMKAGPLDVGSFLLFATIGNVIGGAVFVGGFKYTHAVRGGRLQAVDLEPGKD